MSKELWGLWAEEKEPVLDEDVILPHVGGPINLFEPSDRVTIASGKMPVITSFLDSIQQFSRPIRYAYASRGGVVVNVINTEMSVDADMVEKMLLRTLKGLKPYLKLSGFDREVFFYDEASSFEEMKPNWTQSRGLKGKGFQLKKHNDPKGNPVYGTGWRKK